MKARYARVSTPNQKLERQLIKQNPNDKLYIDVCSGAIPFAERLEGSKLLSDGQIDHISVNSIDRLGRNLLDVLNTLKCFEEKKVVVKVDNLGIESLVNNKPNQAFNLIVSVLANISEMERTTMLERQREGIEMARAKGKYKGRIRGSKESKDEFLSKYPAVIKRLKEGQSLRNTAKLCDVSLGTVQKVKAVL
ncbi:recombinase family protein [Flagellimonas meridianipacifica]|uniref:DNA invertase Pin-like site-specific DNA recombinase n=1 Tax=Flagellimonas meridianipacifica TaxID=1080225 RepID=A0A2T0MAA0_9FLAO|nr:recombinase family protein [Allomuricauda pacifica]PRX54403.1 DNA invertase Pin-like site-specific DNA recombinase [Allomuricauda pacifica]